MVVSAQIKRSLWIVGLGLGSWASGALAQAADSARAVLQVIDRWAAPPDHPRLLAFPEGDYLTVTLVRRIA